jgi:hypothetical protein
METDASGEIEGSNGTRRDFQRQLGAPNRVISQRQPKLRILPVILL